MCPPEHQAGRGHLLTLQNHTTSPFPAADLTSAESTLAIHEEILHALIVASAYIDLTFWMTNTNVVC